MFGPKLGRGSFVVAVACLGILIDGPRTAPASKARRPRRRGLNDCAEEVRRQIFAAT